jgi:Icc-related predicted phosphoesterase
MDLNKILKTTSIKLSILTVSFIILCLTLHKNESIENKARRISFPGVTHINLNRSIKDLNLEKLDDTPNANLIRNLNEHQIKMISSLFKDQQNNLMVVIGEKNTDQQLIFAVIKNNQVTQIQKINEISNNKIILQYGKIILNTQAATSASAWGSDDL